LFYFLLAISILLGGFAGYAVIFFSKLGIFILGGWCGF